MILNTYYGNLTADSLVEAFLDKVDYIDTNDMDAVYKTLFSVLDRFREDRNLLRGCGLPPGIVRVRGHPDALTDPMTGHRTKSVLKHP